MKFTSILRDIIAEASRFEIYLDNLTKPTVDKKGNKQKPKLTKEELFSFIEADPTSSLNNVDLRNSEPSEWENVKVGKYVQWIISRYLGLEPEVEKGHPAYERELKQKREVFMEDLYKVNNDLKKFVRFNKSIPLEKRDILKLNSTAELYDLVKDFSLEKTKASKEEKKSAVETYEYPGSEIAFRGDMWTVVKISDKGNLGKDAACFFGGYNLEPPKGETGWCTSSPGYNWFERYIAKGPLYVVLPNNWSGKRGEKTGLPANRYQFHFPDNQFMNEHDRSIDLIKFLNGEGQELKEYFKPEFAKGLTSQGEKLEIDNFDSGSIGKFVALYGISDLFKTLPETLDEISISNRQGKDITIQIPPDIDRFQNLEVMIFDNCIDSIPPSVCNLKKLRFFSAMNCPKLVNVPECFANMPRFQFLNLKGSANVIVPEAIKSAGEDYGDNMFDLTPSQ